VVGLAVARRLALAGRRVTVLEAEADFGLHTSSRGSWVIHSGLYYPADSFKAKLCQAGRHMLYAYCDARGVHFEKRGKIVVAVSDDQVSCAGSRSRQLCSHTLLALFSHRNLVWQVCVTLPQNLRSYFRDVCDCIQSCRSTTSVSPKRATRQVSKLEALLENGHRNGATDLRWMPAEEACSLEPALHCVAALFSPATGVVDGRG